MKRPNRSGNPGTAAPERPVSKILVFTYSAVTVLLLCSLGMLITLPLWDDPELGRRLALTLCHTSFRLAVMGVVSGLIFDIAAGNRRQ